MASSVSTIGQLVSVIRGQLSSRPEITSTNKGASPSRPTKKPGTHHADGLESLIQLRVKSIARDDPQRGRKAFRVFLESILLSHFGEHLINDPKFYQVIDDIQLSMESDPEVRKLVDTAVEHLLSQTG